MPNQIKEGRFSVGSLFAGIGGICIAFNDTDCTIKWANEIDKLACKTYILNNKHINTEKIINDDISNFNPTRKDKVDILVAGFPCQPFSQAGHRKGFDDPRGKLFFEMTRIIKIIKPRAIFFENVSVLASHDSGKTLKTIKNELQELGYHSKEMIFNSKDYGNVPQSRNRIYIVGFRRKEDMKNFSDPKPIPLVKKIEDILDLEDHKEQKYYYSQQNAKHYDKFVEEITEKNAIYQWRRVYVRKNKNGLCPTLTANMGFGGHNVPIIIDNYGIRKLTPEECLKFQGFPDGYIFPEFAEYHKYRQIGNSVTIPVVKRIADAMVKAMIETDSKR